MRVVSNVNNLGDTYAAMEGEDGVGVWDVPVLSSDFAGGAGSQQDNNIDKE